MKTIYILLTRSGTLLSKLVYAVTGASYTHASMAFDEELNWSVQLHPQKRLYHVPGGAQQGIPEPGRVPPAGECALRAVCAGCER